MKTKLLIIAIALPLVFGCEKKEQGDNVLPELPELKAVEDVCEQMTDLGFMSYCYENFDVNKDGKVSMSEAQAVSVIKCNTAMDFIGVEYFTNITEFKSSSVKTVNLAYNKKLVSIDCSNAPLETIDLRYNTLVSEINFRECKKLTGIFFADGVPVESMAFSGCSSLTSIEIPANLQTLANTMFSGCSSLVNVTFAKDSKLVSIEKGSDRSASFYGAFLNCLSLKSIAFPDGLTMIGDLAFMNCNGLTSVSFPDGLTSIGSSAFKYCKSLTSVSFPNGLTSIGSWAFFSCSSLTSVTLPYSITFLGYQSFASCEKLVDVTIFAVKPPENSGMFGLSPDMDRVLRVPAGSVDAYKSSAWGHDFNTIVEIK